MMQTILSNMLRGPQVTFAKRTVRREPVPFELDLRAYGAADYERIIPALRQVERQLLRVPASSDGMRWIHLPDTVHFLGERRFEIPYEAFVARVDISHVGEFYRDSLSTATVVVERDVRGRAVRQGVRVVALPQPNYSSFMGKGNLDVYKLEKIDYGEHEQRIWMLTVHSPNGSAVCDDGYTSFRRSADGKGTIVAFLACQNFPVPPLMALARLDRWRWFKTVVTESAYRRFFRVMMANVLDCHRGRDFRVGRSPGR